MNYDLELEKRYHSENFDNYDADLDPDVLNEDDLQEASDLIALLDDAVTDLDRFSVRHDDLFNSEIIELQELVKRCRKQL